MNLFPSDVLVLAVLTQLVEADPHTYVHYEHISKQLMIPLGGETIARCVRRLEAGGHLRRVGGLTRKGYKYELSTAIHLAVTFY